MNTAEKPEEQAREEGHAVSDPVPESWRRFVGLTGIQRVRLAELSDAYFAQVRGGRDADPATADERVAAALSPAVSYCLRERIRTIDLLGPDLNGDDAERYPVAMMAARYIENVYAERENTGASFAELLWETRLKGSAGELVTSNPDWEYPDAGA